MMWVAVGQTLDSTYLLNESMEDMQGAWDAQVANKTETWVVYPAMFPAIYGGGLSLNSQAFRDYVGIAQELGRNAQMIDDYHDLLCIESDDKLLLGDVQEVWKFIHKINIYVRDGIKMFFLIRVKQEWRPLEL